MRHIKKEGYIIPLVLLLISGAMALITLLMNRATLFTPFASTMIYKQQARMLALSGGQIALSQLNKAYTIKKSEKSTTKPEAAQDPSLILLAQLLPNLNRWQQFDLKKNIDGVNGTIKIAISSEEGKIPINKLYDFKQHKFRVKTKQIDGKTVIQADWRLLLQIFFDRIQSQMNMQNLFKELEEFLKKRDKPLTDVTELITIPSFANFNNYQFYLPPATTTQKRPLYLTDIFSTIAEGAPTIEPWLLSDSMLGLLAIERAQSQDHAAHAKLVQNIIKQFKPSATWTTDWANRLQPLYKKDIKELPPQFTEFLNPSFTARTFSVISYGIVNGVTERLYLIIELKESSDSKNNTPEFIIKKLYWI